MTRHHRRPRSIRPCTTIWLVLMILTGATYSIGDAGLGGTNIMLTVLAIAFVKSQMIASFFMGLRNSGLMWRLIMGGYLVLVTSMIAVAYLIAIK